jgi:hypothetical protein
MYTYVHTFTQDIYICMYPHYNMLYTYKFGCTYPSTVTRSITTDCSVPLSPFFSCATITEKEPCRGFWSKGLNLFRNLCIVANRKCPNPVFFFCPLFGPCFPRPLDCLGYHENSSQGIPFHNKQEE